MVNKVVYFHEQEERVWMEMMEHGGSTSLPILIRSTVDVCGCGVSFPARN